MLRFSLILITLFLFFSCATNTEEDNGNTPPKVELNVADTVLGKWELIEGKRNGKVTSTMEGATFEFLSGDQLASNLLGIMEQTSYTLTDKTIAQRGGKFDTDYQVAYLAQDSMTLTTRLRGFNFDLKLVRVQSTEGSTEETTSEN